MIVTIMDNKNKKHLDAVKKMVDKNAVSIDVAAIANQFTLIALSSKDEVLGFLSYKEDYSCDYIPASPLNNIYVVASTVDLSSNKIQIVSDFYQYLQDLYPNHEIYTNIVSSDTTCVQVLTECGFVFHTVVENRGRPKGDIICFKYSPVFA